MSESTQLSWQVFACSLICFAILAMSCIAVVVVRALVSDARHRRLRTGLLPLRPTPNQTLRRPNPETAAAA